MDDFLRSLIDRKFKIGKFTVSFLEILLVAGITFVGIMLRYSVIGYVSQDYKGYWEPWISEIRLWGNITALSGDFYDYTPPFMYLLLLISKSSQPMIAFKVLMSIFDVLCAVAASMIVFTGTKNRNKAVGTYAVMTILPTIVANSALWAQCDVIYTTLLLFCIYFFLKDRPFPAMIFYGISFAFKLQALFIFPVLVILWVKGRVKIRHFFLVPLIYVIGVIPAWIAGRPLKDLLLIYLAQGYTDTWALTLNWPNIYEIIGKNFFISEYSTAGKCLIVAMLMIILYYMVKKKYRITNEFIVQMVLFFAMITVYFLPFMHERYGYLADIMAVIYFMFNRKKFYIPMIHLIVSFVSYQMFLTKQDFVAQGITDMTVADETGIPMVLFSFLLLGIMIDVGISLFLHIRDHGMAHKAGVADGV